MTDVQDVHPTEKTKMDKTKKKHTVRDIIIFSIAIFAYIVAWIVSWIPVKERFTLDLIKDNEASVRAVVISDLHSCYYGKNQKTLLNMIDEEEPDIILMPGDIFDDKLKDDNTKTTLEYLVKKYPCYYVTGNHEYWSGRPDEMKAYLRGIGVHVLEGECESVEINGCTLDICGINDPDGMPMSKWREELDNAYNSSDASHPRILLSHRPELVSEYEKYDFDVILVGHAHSGQFRIPFINRGVFAPNQGFLAKYVNGEYKLNSGSIMIVSRGLGRESTPLPRFFNNPEILVLDLK